MALGLSGSSALLNFNEQLQLAKTEFERENVALFNEGTMGAITLGTMPTSGDIADKHYFGKIAGLVGRRQGDAQGTASKKSLGQLSQKTIKIASGTPAMGVTQDWYRRILVDPSRAAVVLGEQLAYASMKDKAEAAIACCAGAFAKGNLAAGSGGYGVGAIIHDIYPGAAPNKGAATAASKLGLLDWNNTLKLFGDNANRIVCMVCHSEVYRNYIGKNVSDGTLKQTSLFNYMGIGVQSDFHGKPLIVTDNPALLLTTTSGKAQKYLTLGLVAGGIEVADNADMRSATEIDVQSNDGINDFIKFTWTFNVGVEGYSYTGTAASASIYSNSTLATPGNWSSIAEGVKSTAGIGCISSGD